MSAPLPDDEREALLRCQSGDREAYRLIVERYGDVLYRTAYNMTGERGQAEDAVQDALIAAWRGLRTFNLERPLRPWLLRVLVNEVLQRRRRKLLGVIPLPEAARELPARDPGPADVAERDWRDREVRAAIGRLPRDAARLVTLRYFGELSTAELAEALDVPEGTVKSRLHRALKRLRDELAARGVLGKE